MKQPALRLPLSISGTEQLRREPVAPDGSAVVGTGRRGSTGSKEIDDV